jgi:hypothetical protein
MPADDMVDIVNARDMSRTATLRDEVRFRSWVSVLDLKNRNPLLFGSTVGDQRENGIFMRTPTGELITDRSSTGYLMGPAGADLAKVAEAGRLFGAAFRYLLGGGGFFAPLYFSASPFFC